MKALLLLASLALCWAQTELPRRQVAITIDDLPVAQSGSQACDYERLRPLTERLLAPFRQRRIPLVGFVIPGQCKALTVEQQRSILELWRKAGAELGNHTYSHPSLNNVPIEEYEQDILRADDALRTLSKGRHMRYFRSPYLHTGPDKATKERLEAFLAAHQYQQAPVTLDNSEWLFAAAYHAAQEAGEAELARRIREEYVPYMESVIAFFERRSVAVVGREFPQVLLLHANQLNAEMLPALLTMLERRGYRFVSLTEALQDEAYRLPDQYTGKGGISWIHRWSQTKGMPNEGEPDEPQWLQEAWRRLQKP